jgi:ElaB/YqjD/DUF883 family membrane-anchored ribosome-binding protein
MSNTSGTGMRDTLRDTARDTVRDAKEAVRESGRAASAASGDIQADLESLRGDVARLTQQIGDIFSSRGNAAWSRAKSNVEGVMSDVSAKGQEAVDAVREVGDNVVDAIDESLRRRPYTTLAIAAAIGFLFGATWRR